MKALSLVYPTYKWRRDLLSNRSKKSSQRLLWAIPFLTKARWLKIQLQHLFGKRVSIQENFNHDDMKWGSGRRFEIDVWIPSLNLAVEYQVNISSSHRTHRHQGEQHYHITNAYGTDTTPMPTLFERDFYKQQKYTESGVSIVYVPYWWEGDESSLRVIMSESWYSIFLVNANIDSPELE